MTMLVNPFRFGAGGGGGGTPPAANYTAFSADGATTPWVGGGLTSPGYYDSTNNRTYIAYETWLGGARQIRVGYYDHGSSSWSAFYKAGVSPLTDDDHGTPAIIRDADGYIHIFFGSHSTAMKHSVTTSPDDVSAWSAQSDIGSSLSYPHPVLVGSTLYLFCRYDGANPRPCRVYKSTSISAGVVTWDSGTDLFSFGTNTWAYPGGYELDGTDIHIVSCYHDSTGSTRNNIYYFKYDTTTGSITDYTGTHTVASGSLPATNAPDYLIHSTGSNQTDIPAICLATDGTVHFAFLEGTGTSYDIKHMTLSGTTLSSATTVTSGLTMGIGTQYVEAIELVALASAQVEVWYPKDQAASWDHGGDMTRQVYSSGSWGSAETVLAAGTYALARPTAVVNGIADARILFTEIKQDSLDSDAGGLHPYVGGTTALAARSYSEWASWETLLVKTDLANGSTTIPDESPYARGNATVNGNAQISTTSPLIGTGSLALDGTGDWISFPNSSDYSVGNTADRTFECFIYVTSFSHSGIIMGKRPVHVVGHTDDGEFLWWVDTTAVLRMVAYDSSSTAMVNLTGTGTISINTRYHVALSRASGTWRMFLEGAVDASGAQSGAPAASTSALNIGRSDRNTGLEFIGKIDEPRAHAKAIYTAAFTAPTTAFPRVAA